MKANIIMLSIMINTLAERLSNRGKQNRVQQQTTAQRGAYGHSVFENRAHAAHRDNVACRFHSAPSEYHERRSGENEPDNAVDSGRQPVIEGERNALACLESKTIGIVGIRRIIL